MDNHRPGAFAYVNNVLTEIFDRNEHKYSCNYRYFQRIEIFLFNCDNSIIRDDDQSQ